jgi:hypothetical protein
VNCPWVQFLKTSGDLHHIRSGVSYREQDIVSLKSTFPQEFHVIKKKAAVVLWFTLFRTLESGKNMFPVQSTKCEAVTTFYTYLPPTTVVSSVDTQILLSSALHMTFLKSHHDRKISYSFVVLNRLELIDFCIYPRNF